MAIKSYRYEAEVLVKEYLLSDSFVPYTSVLGGIFMCKMAYDLSHLVSSYYVKGYPSLPKIQRIEWSNRGMSSAHAVYITLMSLYLVFFSDIFTGDAHGGFIVFRSSPLSISTLGVSLGYFITDLAMILWLYPSLGGMEYIIHHLLSVLSISYAMFSGQGQLYVFLVLISETTTPGINLRWFLDTAGMKRSKAYLVNGVGMFFTWVVARILLFIYLFYHLYTHYEEVGKMDIIAYNIVLSVPSILAVMNVVWFGKILRGLQKTMEKRQ